MQDIVLLKKRIIADKRGYFFEAYNRDTKKSLVDVLFKQSSVSVSKKNVLRGMHYQFEQPMGKMINVIQGHIIEKILDVRKDSNTFGKIVTYEMNSSSDYSIYIPPGFAHGFLSLSDNTIVMYKQTAYYNPLGEGCINPLMSKLDFNWPIEKHKIIISEKDLNSPSFENYSKKRNKQ